MRKAVSIIGVLCYTGFHFAIIGGTDAMLPHYSQIIADSPTRPVDWRWRRACRLVEERRRLLSAHDDDATLQGARYLRLFARNSRQAVTEFPHIDAARKMREDTLRTVVEARLLAGQSSAQIASVIEIGIEVVDTYESLFYSCRDRLEARDWIAIHAIGRPSAPDITTLIKMFAYFGGVISLEAVLEALRCRTQGIHDDANDLVLLALDAVILPDSELTFSRLSRLMAELLSQPRYASENVGATARTARPTALSPSDLAREICALQAATHACSGPAAAVEPPVRSIPGQAMAV
jgi:hypothetical protein